MIYSVLVETSTRTEAVTMTERFETFTVLVNRISRNIRKIKNKEMEECNLRSPHISCLYYLYTSEGLTATELCEKCEEDKATMSRSLDYLEKNGFLTSDAKLNKRYKTPLILTEKGKDAGKKIADKIDFILGEVSNGLSDEERQIFYRALNLISSNLDNICKQYNV